MSTLKVSTIESSDDVTDLVLKIGTAERSRLDKNGNLLIGRTNSTVGQGVKLDVAGSINASSLLINGAPISLETTKRANISLAFAITY